METVAERLRAAIAEWGKGSIRGFQKALAESEYSGKGASREMIHRYTREEDPVTPPLEFISAAAQLLGVREAWLATGQGHRTEAEEQTAAARSAEARESFDDAALDGFLIRGSDVGSSWRRAAVLRFVRRLEDAGVADTDRVGLLTAAVRFLEGAERAYAESGRAMDYGAGAWGWSQALEEPGHHTPAGYVAWSDAVLSALVARVRGFGAPAKRDPREMVIAEPVAASAESANTQEASNGGEAEA